MRPKSNGALRLQEAVTLLIQNQAKFVSVEVESARRFARIERDLDEIKTALQALIPAVSRHDQELRELTQALRQKIGFKTE